VQVLEDEEKRLVLTLPDHEALHRVERLLATLDGIQRLPRSVPDRHVEQGQQGWQGRFQRAVQGEERARYFLASSSLPRGTGAARTAGIS
jgi:hypothetical protein